MPLAVVKTPPRDLEGSTVPTPPREDQVTFPEKRPDHVVIEEVTRQEDQTVRRPGFELNL